MLEKLTFAYVTKTTYILRKLKIRHRISKYPLTTLIQINPDHMFTIHFSNIKLNIILLYWVLTVTFLENMYLTVKKQ
jgi:hypothetical protein